MANLQEVQVTQPHEQVEGMPTRNVQVSLTSVEWLTPGSYIAKSIAGRGEVRMVLQRPETDRCSVYVVLDEDPEDLLDFIFNEEQEFRKSHKMFLFDLRVITPSSDWSDKDLLKGSFAYYKRG